MGDWREQVVLPRCWLEPDDPAKWEPGRAPVSLCPGTRVAISRRHEGRAGQPPAA